MKFITSKLKSGLVGLLLALILPISILTADISGAFYFLRVTFLNVAVPTVEVQAAFPISGSSLRSGEFISSTALNSEIQSGGLQQPAMPASDRTRMLGSVAEVSSAFTDFTTASNAATFADVELLPETPGNDDAFYFIGDNPYRILTLNIGQEAVNSVTGSFVYEYFNGTSYVTASDVDDRTQQFTRFGVNTISFDVPSDWVKTTVCCSIDPGYVFRVRLQEAPTQTQQPLATQIWYETGLWWTWIDELEPEDQRSFVLYLGGPDMVDNHQMFLGNEGIVTPDDAFLEVGDTYGIQVDARFSPFTVGACVVCKGDALRLEVTDTNELTLSVTGSEGFETLVMSNIVIPDSGTQLLGIDSDGVTLRLSLTGNTPVDGSAVSVEDNSDNWTWATTGATAYVDSIGVSTQGVFGEFETFETKTEWDEGVFSNAQSVLNQQDFTITYIVEQGSSDGYWCNNDGGGIFLPSSSTIRFGWDGSNCGTGGADANSFFLIQVDIPQGTEIETAYLQLEPERDASNTDVNVQISAEDTANATAPVDIADAEGRTRTTATVDWDEVEAFDALSYPSNNQYDTPDITTILQEIIDRPDWVSGNSILFFIEDNGSTMSSGTTRTIASFEDGLSPVKLKVVLPKASVQDDFIRNTRVLGVPIGWTQVSNGGGNIVVTDVAGVRYGNWAVRLNPSSGSSNFRGLQQTFPASEGEVWSASAQTTSFFSNDNGGKHIRIDWLDSEQSVISSEIQSVPSSGSINYTTVTLNGRTAPANTAFARVGIRVTCTFFGCSQSGRHWDGVVACVCATAPPFGDSANIIVNPSFESIYRQLGTWTSPTINSPVETAQETVLFWNDLIGPGLSTYDGTTIAEVSIDGAGGPFLPAENGESVPGIDPGDNLSELDINIRFTLETTGSDVGAFTPIISQAFIAFVGAAGPDNADLFYQLDTMPSFFITDQTGNAQHGFLHLPLPASLPVAVVSALQPVDPPVAAEGDTADAGDFAAPVEEPPNLLGGGGFGEDLPLKPFFDLVADVSDVPVQVFMIMFAMIVTIYAGAGMFYSFQSVTAGYMAMLISLIGFTFVDQGVIPWWVVFAFGFGGAFWVFSDRSSP